MNALIKKTSHQFIVLIAMVLLYTAPLTAQNSKTPTLSDVNTKLEDQKTQLVNIAETIMLIILVGAFVFLIANLWLKWTQPQNAIVGFLTILLVYSLFTVIF